MALVLRMLGQVFLYPTIACQTSGIPLNIQPGHRITIRTVLKPVTLPRSSVRSIRRWRSLVKSRTRLWPLTSCWPLWLGTLRLVAQVARRPEAVVEIYSLLSLTTSKEGISNTPRLTKQDSAIWQCIPAPIPTHVHNAGKRECPQPSSFFYFDRIGTST
jgi:hypothetical protein